MHLSGASIAGIVVGSIGLLILLIGIALIASGSKPCEFVDEACDAAKNRKKAGIGMVVVGIVMVIIGVIILIVEYRKESLNRILDTDVLEDSPDYDNYRVSESYKNQAVRGGADCIQKCADELAFHGNDSEFLTCRKNCLSTNV